MADSSMSHASTAPGVVMPTVPRADSETVEMLPKNFLQIFENQVAGHLGQKTKKPSRLLKCADGTVLKPVQKPPKGIREVDFYQYLLKNKQPGSMNDVETKLLSFLPRFYGMIQAPSPVDGVLASYIKMEDVTGSFQKPCIADLKMGRRTYDPNATAQKIAYELSKYPPLDRLGFQILGMRVYDPSTQQFSHYDREYGRSLQEDHEVIHKGLGVFYNLPGGLRRDAIKATLNRLNLIKNWFQGQRQFSFYSSSLLLMYEGAVNQSTQQCKATPPLLCSCTPHAAIAINKNCDKDYEIIKHAESIKPGCMSAAKSCCNSEPKSTHASDKTNSFHSKIVGNNNTINSVSPEMNSSVVHTELADVKMIDFTHVYHVDKPDDNYLHGILYLIDMLNKLLDM